MAEEIKAFIGLSAAKDNFTFPKVGGGQEAFTMTGVGGGVPGTVSIPTTAGGTVVDLSALTTPGWAYFKNLDDTNYVQHGPESGGAMVAYGRLEAGEPAGLRLDPGVTVRMLANTAACLVQILVLED
jgi:hypothetical protein